MVKKTTIFLCTALLSLTTLTGWSQNIVTNANTLATNYTPETNQNKDIFYKDNGFKFETFKTGINTKYSDYGVGFFRDKFISFSARKIGAFTKQDPHTGEPFTKLYCSDITFEYDLKKSQLFSSILNQKENLGTITFSKDGNTLYYTESKKGDSKSFDIYRADMNPNREGEWVNITPLSINGDYSIENPHLSRNGEWLYFASNQPEAIGGFDIFKIAIKNNTIYGNPERLEGSVNTVLDEKFPQTSLNGKYLYFSSNGHDTQGGYDIFRSRKTTMRYVSTRNLGNSINSPKDELAYIQATANIGYMTSNRDGGAGGYDIYKIKESIITLSITGRVLDSETQIPLKNANIVLLDEYGEEVSSTQSSPEGTYNFPVDGFINYTILAYKEGFKRANTSINTDAKASKTFIKDLSLAAIPAEIVETKEKTIIKIENIQFDLNSAKIKDISTISLNTVAATLKANPEIRININAHTDAQGSAIYNKELSIKRAASAMDYLISKGIPLTRLRSKGFGEEQLLIDCTSCTGQQHELNRRIEFVVTKD